MSDIYSAIVLRDGKVLTGSESGNLLLWEGNFIKAIVKRKNGDNSHSGNIKTLERVNDSLVVSGGVDNCICFWDLTKIDSLEGDEEMIAFLDPVREIKMDPSSPFDLLNIQLDFLHSHRFLIL